MNRRPLLILVLSILTLVATGCQKSKDFDVTPTFVAPMKAEQLSDLNPPALVCKVRGGCPQAIGQLVAVTPQGRSACTVSLVKNDVVLTASHCVPWESVNPDGTFQGNCWVRWPEGSSHGAGPVDCESVVEATQLRESKEDRVQLDHAYIRLAAPVSRTLLSVDGSSVTPDEQSRGVRLYGTVLAPEQHELHRLDCDRNDNYELPSKETLPGETIILPACPIQVGFSGGPIMDERTEKILGVISFMKMRPTEDSPAGPAVGTRAPWPEGL